MGSRAPETALWETLRGALAARALGLAADLRIADLLADGPRRVEELAAGVGADPDTLHRVLRALASDGIFVEGPPRTFANTTSSELLRTGWGAFAHLFGGPFYRAVGGLQADGRASFPQVYGTEFWSWLSDHPDEREVFDGAMEQGKERRAERIAALDWRDGETVVDVGGGNGSLLLELLRRKPGLRGIVYDLPETVRDEPALAAAGIEFVPGSFFEQVPGGGDVYVLGTILHDWDDDRSAAILETIRSCAPAGARLLIVDAVVAPGNDPQGAKWLDLLMLALSEGRERTAEQWRQLLDRARLSLIAIEDGLIQAACP